MRIRPVRATLVALAVLLFGPLAARAAAYPSAADTRAEFEQVCRRLTDGEDPFFGTAIVGDLESRIERTGGNPQLDALLGGRLGFELVRLGRLEEAISRLETAVEAAAPAEVDPAVQIRMLEILGAAHLLRAEDLNCVERHSAASCILPIAPEAVHTLPDTARRAGDIYLRILDAAPEAVQPRWLLNLSRMISGDFPAGVPAELRLPPGALAPEADFPPWRDIAPELGVNAFDLSGGAVMEDFDGDGLLDLVSSSSGPCDPMKAFRSDGEGGFTDVAAAWGLDGQLGGLNLIQADFDDDGQIDLLVLRGGWWGRDGRIRNSLLRNDLRGPTGRFVDVTAAAGLAYPAFPTQTAAWADFDGDGDLDVYVGNEATAAAVDPVQLFGKTGDAFPSQLFRNNGNGTFTDVGRAAGVANHRYAKAVTWGDYDNDGDPDLYISNIGPNRLYRNDGDGTFTDVAPELGVMEPAQESFTSWFFDYDNDGDLDLLVADYGSRIPEVSGSFMGVPGASGQPLLYRNEAGRFTEISRHAGLRRPALPMGANYGDLDNDGWLDFYLGTGVPDFDALMPNLMYRNEDGRRFADVTFAGRFGHLQKGHGVAFGDLDNDGDQDLFQQLGGAYPYDAYGNALYLNPGTANRWITLRLEGRQANRFGIGARIAVEVRAGGEVRTIHALAGSGGSFGASSLQQEIGLGSAEAIARITIEWPGSGSRQIFSGVPLDGFYRAVEGSEALAPIEAPLLHLGNHRPGPTHSHQKETDS